MADALTCETCQFWLARPGAYYGECAMRVVYGRVAFDYQPCAYHSGLEQVLTPTIDMQSQARGGPPWPNPGIAQWVKP